MLHRDLIKLMVPLIMQRSMKMHRCVLNPIYISIYIFTRKGIFSLQLHEYIYTVLLNILYVQVCLQCQLIIKHFWGSVSKVNQVVSVRVQQIGRSGKNFCCCCYCFFWGQVRTMYACLFCFALVCNSTQVINVHCLSLEWLNFQHRYTIQACSDHYC